ncbi:Protein MAIN-LIKE 1 [Glycine max]|nr:Protein MAIN-LIKE 1 [Glycine max]
MIFTNFAFLYTSIQERPELKLSSHRRKVHSLGRPVPAIKGLVAGTRLSPLIACSVDTGDRGLLSSFVEQWHRETSSFHLPMGELTSTLDDVSSILHLPVVGDLHVFQPLHVDDAVQMLVDLLMAGHWTAAARAYLLHLLGCTLFANKSATNVHVMYLEVLRDLSQTGRYAWGVTTLVHMYDQLNDASISSSRQLDGYITLLQCWIYEHSPSVAESTADQDYDEDSPRACRYCNEEDREEHTYSVVQGAPGSTPDSGCLLDPIWGALTGPGLAFDFMLFWSPALGSCCCLLPTREGRATIPAPPVDSWVSYDDIHDRWMHYSDHIVPAGEVCAVPDPLQPRVVPQPPQTNIPHVPEPGAPSTSARPAVEEPRHAVEVCHWIAERLERHLSLGVVTPGSSTHEVIEECLRMARSVTQDQLAYIRFRRRRHTD